jgi:hypothetical protein
LANYQQSAKRPTDREIKEHKDDILALQAMRPDRWDYLTGERKELGDALFVLRGPKARMLASENEIQSFRNYLIASWGITDEIRDCFSALSKGDTAQIDTLHPMTRLDEIYSYFELHQENPDYFSVTQGMVFFLASSIHPDDSAACIDRVDVLVNLFKDKNAWTALRETAAYAAVYVFEAVRQYRDQRIEEELAKSEVQEQVGKHTGFKQSYTRHDYFAFLDAISAKAATTGALIPAPVQTMITLWHDSISLRDAVLSIHTRVTHPSWTDAKVKDYCETYQKSGNQPALSPVLYFSRNEIHNSTRFIPAMLSGRYKPFLLNQRRL